MKGPGAGRMDQSENERRDAKRPRDQFEPEGSSPSRRPRSVTRGSVTRGSVTSRSVRKEEGRMAEQKNIYYTPAELAKIWGCSKDVIYVMLHQGRLKGFKLVKDWRITEAARIAYEEGLDCTKAETPPAAVNLVRGTGKVLTKLV